MFQAAAKTDVLIADIGGTNCRFQVWQLDAHFRPSRMVVEQVHRRRRCRLPPACFPAQPSPLLLPHAPIRCSTTPLRTTPTLLMLWTRC